MQSKWYFEPSDIRHSQCLNLQWILAVGYRNAEWWFASADEVTADDRRSW